MLSLLLIERFSFCGSYLSDAKFKKIINRSLKMVFYVMLQYFQKRFKLITALKFKNLLNGFFIKPTG